MANPMTAAHVASTLPGACTATGASIGAPHEGTCLDGNSCVTTN